MAKFDPIMFDGPTPGESLTNDPGKPQPWERPPRFTKKEDAIVFLSDKIVTPTSIHMFVDQMRRNVPVEDITKIILFSGFAQGLWNPDLLLLLIEPTMFMLIFIAEQSGVNPMIYAEEEEDLSPEEEIERLRDLQQKMESTLPKGLMSKMKEKVKE